MRDISRYVLGIMLGVSLAGCNDPTTMGRFRATPVTNVILDNVGVVDEPPAVFEGARRPQVEDLLAQPKEYVIEPGDFLRVTIFELDAVGVQREEQVQVSNTGRITLPVIGTLMAAGRTELELTEEIVDKLSPNIIVNPQVSVSVLQSVSRRFYISGVAAPGPYPITGYDLRIRDAFAMAGGIPQFNADYAYVIRTVSEGAWDASDEDEWSQLPPRDMDELIPPLGSASRTPDAESDEPVQISSNWFSSGDDEPENVAAGRESRESVSFDSETTDPNETKPLKVVPSDGGFVLNEAAPAAGDMPLLPPLSEDVPQEMVAGLIGNEGGIPEQEVIRIDLNKLAGGDARENIVIRPGDDIHVPPTSVGIFYVYGQVRGPGPYQMTSGQRMTVKQVVAVAGGLSALAWPTRCEIVRRTGENQETIVPINLRMIMDGSAPDLFIKPGDIINIGSHPVAQWLAVVRSSFRATYGFGFVYDRNFADKDFGH